MFWGCVSSRGEEALIPVLGTIDSVKYIDIFKNYLIPSQPWYFGNHTETFQQDNASWHALKIVIEYLDKNDICVCLCMYIVYVFVCVFMCAVKITS